MQPKTQESKNKSVGEVEKEKEKRHTTPTLTLSGLGSAKKASVTPRIGSLGAGAKLRHHDDMDLAPTMAVRPMIGPDIALRIAISPTTKKLAVESESAKREVYFSFLSMS